MRYFMKEGVRPEGIKHTFIVFIPKVPNLDEVGQSRPISLCNLVYKNFSKILVLRIKPFLPGLIMENQSAFIGRRLIQDNVIIVQEAFHYLKNKKFGKNWEAALKTDKSKAYDILEWDFLEALLRKLGFCRELDQFDNVLVEFILLNQANLLI